MYLIVGLGNPGKEYENTRHNIGYLTVGLLARRWGIDMRRRNFNALFGEGRVGAQKVVLALPETYMNESGRAVRDLYNWYKCEHCEIILIYDDADLPVGYIRVRPNGSAGTHNGMRSVVYQLGFDDFPRVRVGIGSAAHDMVHHVLGVPQGEEATLLNRAMEDAAAAIELILRGEIEEARTRYNHKPPKAKEAREAEARETEAQEEASAKKTDGEAQAQKL